MHDPSFTEQYRIIWLGRSKPELRAIRLWYARIAPWLLARFEQALARALSELADLPRRWIAVGQGVRRLLLRGFPYALYYRVVDTRLEILHIVHQRRSP